jgi:hypothetical protein
MSALKVVTNSASLSPARDALRGAIRDLAASQDALDRTEQPCRELPE